MRFLESIKNSLEKNKKGIIMMLCSSLCVCLGQMFWKLADGGEMAIFFLGCGFFLYGIGAVVMVLAYRYGSLSVLQPMLAANYIFAPIIARIVLDEVIEPRRIFAIAVIIIGIMLIGGGDE